MLHILVSLPLSGTEESLDTRTEEAETHEFWWPSTNWTSSCFSAMHCNICLCIKMVWCLILTLTLAFDPDFDLDIFFSIYCLDCDLFRIWFQKSWNLPDIHLFMWHMCPTNFLPRWWPHACAWALFHTTMDLFPVNVEDISEPLGSQMALFLGCATENKL